MTTFILRAAALALIAAMAVALPAVAATPPQQQTQVPGYYRMMLGDVEITALYDGSTRIDPAILKGISEKELQPLLARYFMPTDGGVRTAVNAYLVNTGSKLVLVDTGAGTCFGPTLGNVPDNMRAAGYEPPQVDDIFITHLHPDHVCGLLTGDGEMIYPNAEVWVTQADADYWLSDEVEAKAPEGAQPFFDMAQKSVAPYVEADQFNTFTPGDAPVAGVMTVAEIGHTPGHTAYRIDGPEHDLLIWGDIVHNFAVQFPRPEVAINFDVDSPQAIATRKQLFAMLAKNKLWVAGAHLPFPGLGHVWAKGDRAYAWVPIRYHTLD